MDSTIGNVPEILLGFLTEAAGGEGLPPQKKLLHSIDVIEKKEMEELQKLKTSSAAMEADRRNTIQILMPVRFRFFPNGSDCRCRHAKLPGPPPPVEEVLQKIQQLTSYNYNSNKFFEQRNAGLAQQGERPQVPQGSNAVSQGFAGKPSMVESANVQQPQQQV